MFIEPREYRTYRGVTTSRLKAPIPLVVHDNLKTFTKYSERSVQNLYSACLSKAYSALSDIVQFDVIRYKS